MKYLTLLQFLGKDLIHDAGRTFLTVLNLSAVLFSYFLLAALAVGLSLAGNQQANSQELVVIEKTALDPMQSQLTPETLSALNSLGPTQIERIFPFIFHHLNIGDYLVQVRGVPSEEFTRTYQLVLNQGDWPRTSNEVVISEGAVHYASWGLDSLLTIYGRDFRVSGIVQMPETSFATVWMTLETAEKTFQSENKYQGAVIILPQGINPEEIQFAIESLPALKDRYAAYLLDDIFQRFAQVLKDAKIISYALTWISLIMVTMGVYHTIHLNLEERNHEMTLLHAAGFSIFDLQKILLTRVVMQAVCSFLIAWSGAILTINRFESISPIVLHGEHIPVSLNPAMLISGFLLMLVFSILGVWLPTRRLSTSSILSVSSW